MTHSFWGITPPTPSVGQWVLIDDEAEPDVPNDPVPVHPDDPPQEDDPAEEHTAPEDPAA